MASGFARAIVLHVSAGSPDRVTLGFFLSSEDGSLAVRWLRDPARAAAFAEMEPEWFLDMMDDWVEHQVRDLPHEQRRTHEAHYMSSVQFEGLYGFHDPNRTLDEMAEQMRVFVLNEPGDITARREQARRREAEEEARWEAWRRGEGPMPGYGEPIPVAVVVREGGSRDVRGGQDVGD